MHACGHDTISYANGTEVLASIKKDLKGTVSLSFNLQRKEHRMGKKVELN
jgi:metal-dependent amidase/aminoacylase/carboxypeptidase family protein